MVNTEMVKYIYIYIPFINYKRMLSVWFKNMSKMKIRQQ